MTPRVSIVTPYKDADSYLAEAIASVIAQSSEAGGHRSAFLGTRIPDVLYEVGTMGGVQCRGNARPDVHRQFRAEPLLLVEQLAQALAVDELHHHRLAAILGDRGSV